MIRMNAIGLSVAVLLAVVPACRPGSERNAVDDNRPATVTAEPGDDVHTIASRAYDLARNHEYEKACAHLDRAITVFGDAPVLLECYNDVANWTDQHDLALDTALRLEVAAERKSPWNLLKIAEALLKLGRPAEALDYVERAVDERSFKRYGVFSGTVYDPLRDNPRFIACVRRAEEGIGLGSPMRDVTVETVNGKEIPLRSLAGRVVLLDFWATWCAPCRRELPNLKALHDRYAGEGFEIIGVSLDEEAGVVLDYVDRNGIPWPVCHPPGGWQSAVVERYGVNALPSLWLYDRSLILRHYNLRGEELADAVAGLMAEHR
jgi:thiol-disulfide isomerase/thioredoxin